MSIGEWSREGREVGWAGSDGIGKRGWSEARKKKKGAPTRGSLVGCWGVKGRCPARNKVFEFICCFI
jgi:hypothetical protein